MTRQANTVTNVSTLRKLGKAGTRTPKCPVLKHLSVTAKLIHKLAETLSKSQNQCYHPK